MKTFSHLGIIGKGAWGTALAELAERAGHRVTLYGRGEAPAGDLLLVAVPAQAVREVLQPVASGQPLIICAKGVERGTGLLMHEIRPELDSAILSGPNIAAEIMQGLPAATVIAHRTEETAKAYAAALSSRLFRCYPSADVTGVALAGAMKNVLAIALGVVVGRGLGDNARAALIARSIAEMSRMGRAMNASPITMMGLAGIGDLSLTTNRNYRLGVALGRNEPPPAELTEGSLTAEALLLRASRHNVDLPLCAAVASILAGSAIEKVIADILTRPIPEGELA